MGWIERSAVLHEQSEGSLWAVPCPPLCVSPHRHFALSPELSLHRLSLAEAKTHGLAGEGA